MKEKKIAKFKSFVNEEKPDGPFLRFNHKAMNTMYEIVICHDDPVYAGQAAGAAFTEIDRLELELSRFNSNSDISRINALKQFETITIGIDCYQCLKHCATLYQQTRGLFDISAGLIIDLWKKMPQDQMCPPKEKIDSALKWAGMPWLQLLDNYQVQLMAERINLDLGGFGKGYAIQVTRNLLQEWGISNGLISAGMSSVTPLADSRWTLAIRHPEQMENVLSTVPLFSKSISGSGITQGHHIINPATGYPVEDKIAAWAIADHPGISDALSTAFMIMPVADVELYCQEHNAAALLITKQGNVLRIGNF